MLDKLRFPLAVLAVVAAIGGAIVGITVLGGWGTVLEVIGFNPEPIPITPKAHCSKVGELTDQVVACRSPREFTQSVVEACREDPASVEEEGLYLVYDARRAQVAIPRCP